MGALAGLGIVLLLLSIANVVELVHLRGRFPMPQYDLEVYYVAAARLNSGTHSSCTTGKRDSLQHAGWV